MSIENLYQLYITNGGLVSTDTRNISKGALFFALKGEHYNANLLARQALEAGASYAIVDEMHSEQKGIILVDNVLETLQQLATYHRSLWQIPVLGITGSNGKTSTKELCKSVLSQKYRCFATFGNLNNHIGVPLTLLSINANEIDVAIIEMGANHVGEIAALCKIAQPSMGIITNVGKAHLEGFGGFEGVKKAKGELYQYLEANKGLIFINNNNENLREMAPEGARYYSYGSGSHAHLQADYSIEEDMLQVSWQTKSKHGMAKSNLSGAYNFENIVAAIAVGTHFNMDVKDIAAGIASYIPQNNRSQIIKQNSNIIYLDAYNANPSSMEAAIASFSKLQASSKYVILGDMYELGNYSAAEHQKVAESLNFKQFAKVILVGKNFAQTKSNHQLYSSVEDLKKDLQKNPPRNCTVLIKGSRAMKLESLLEVI